MDINTRALVLHKKNRGKIRIESKVPLRNKDDLGLAYTCLLYTSKQLPHSARNNGVGHGQKSVWGMLTSQNAKS